MAYYRLKHTFTSGEISPMMDSRVDFDRYQNGCKKLYNAFCVTQGPGTRRMGTRFLYDMEALGMDPTDPRFREVPFIFNNAQAYALIFFMHTDGTARMAVATRDGLVSDGGTPVILPLYDDWDISSFDYSQSADELYISQGVRTPHIIRRLSSTSWELVAVTFTDQPSDWSDVNGWPTKVVFHQQRIFFANINTKQRTVWGSKAGDYSDFGISSPLIDSDALSFTLDSGTQNSIKWLISSKLLNIGTLGSEWTVAGSNQAALTPLNIYAREQSGSGSEALKPLKIGHTTLFLEEHGRVINEFAYSYNDDGYVTSDITVLADHLTLYSSVVDWTYQRTPNNIIWCIRDDGQMIGLTYQRQHKVVGWHHHETDGKYLTVTSIPGPDREDDVIYIIERTVDGATKYYLESQEKQFKGTKASDGYFLDCHLVYDGDPTEVVNGLDHLIGEEVHVLCEGEVQASQVVAQDGSITLVKEYSQVIAGLNYHSEIRPCLSDVPSNDGTSLSREQVIVEVGINFYNSLGCVIGRIDSEDDSIIEEEIPFRKPSDMTNEEVPLFSGWKRILFPEGTDVDSDYFIRQEQPLPLTVRSVVDKVEVYE